LVYIREAETQIKAMKYNYHDMYDQQFEDLVVQICVSLLGIGVQGFSSGKDGGRDARFVGTAKNYPSDSKPISGKIIVQSKHTTNPIAKFSDPEFSSTASSSELSTEIPKVKTLVKNGELDHYILFANRRLSANANQAILTRLELEAGVVSGFLVGIESLELHLKYAPKAAKFAHLEPIESPLRVSPEALAQVLLAIKGLLEEKYLTPKLDHIKRTSFATKNELNGLSAQYATLIRGTHLKYFSKIDEFLAHPDNHSILDDYQEAVEEFKTKIIAHRDEFSSFDLVLNYLLDRLLERDPDLKRNTRLTRTIVYYMYWICDIGKEPDKDVNADKTLTS
jgi:hypothetical protein